MKKNHATKKGKRPEPPKDCDVCNGFGEICDYCGKDENNCQCQADADDEEELDFEPSFSECEKCGGTGQGG